METRALTVNASHVRRLVAALSVLLLGAAIFFAQHAPAQEPETKPLTPAELEELVGPVALYPDDLLAIVLPAATYPLQIVQAARFLDDRANDETLQPDPEWDDSIVALLNYPEIVRMMNEDLDWTWDLGAAVLADQTAVLDAVQTFRDRAYAAGNLRTDDRQVVTKEEEVIEIAPADPEVVYIPYYEPERVVVYHSTPAYYYYPYAYPLYYYPYPVGYGFTFGFFWGVTSAYSIGWHSHWLHVHHHTHIGHPYYHHPYYTYGPYYGRSGVVVHANTGYSSNVWHHDDHRGGPHPQHRQIRVAYEGRGEPRGDGAAYGFARTPSGTAARSEGGARSAAIARQLGAAREGRSPEPFAAARSADPETQSGAATVTARPQRMLGGVGARHARLARAARQRWLARRVARSVALQLRVPGGRAKISGRLRVGARSEIAARVARRHPAPMRRLRSRRAQAERRAPRSRHRHLRHRGQRHSRARAAAVAKARRSGARPQARGWAAAGAAPTRKLVAEPKLRANERLGLRIERRAERSDRGSRGGTGPDPPLDDAHLSHG
jgi:hypothetical protein